MKLSPLVVAAGVLLASTAIGSAQSPTSEKTPGDQMQDKGSVKGSPGASGYSPGHEMQKGSVKTTTGASGYAPGHETTGSKTKIDTDANVKSGKAGVKTDIDVDAKLKK